MRESVDENFRGMVEAEYEVGVLDDGRELC